MLALYGGSVNIYRTETLSKVQIRASQGTAMLVCSFTNEEQTGVGS